MSCIYPNGTLTEPRVTTDWMGYPGHFGCDYVDFDLNRAILPGTVVFAGYNPSGAGNEVKLDHGTIGGHRIITRYLHNAKVLVKVGQTVTRGMAVGIQGSTGDSTGKHLHFEVLVDGVKVSPRPWLRAHLATSASLNPPEPDSKEDDMIVIYNTEDKNEDTRRAIVRDLSFDIRTAAQIRADRTLGTIPGAKETINVGNADWKRLQAETAQRVAAVRGALTADELKAIGAAVVIDPKVIAGAVDVKLEPRFRSLDAAVKAIRSLFAA